MSNLSLLAIILFPVNALVNSLFARAEFNPELFLGVLAMLLVAIIFTHREMKKNESVLERIAGESLLQMATENTES